MNYLNLICIFFAMLCISSCSITDEGETDVRYAAIPKNTDTKLTPLFLESESSNEVFEDNDLVSFHLIYAFIGDFDESLLVPSELSYVFGRLAAFKWPRRKGEVVITGRVFKFTGNGEGDFTNDSSTDAGRVIFYTDDVLAKQSLNFRNIPMYGPVRFHGSPLALRLEARELDTNSDEEKALLKTLSSVGSAAYAPISPVLGVLNELGSSFIDAQPASTKFFRFSMVFDPDDGGNPHHLHLRPGYYIFLKDGQRQGKHFWHNYLFCPKEGKLFKKDSDTKKNTCNKAISGELHQYRDNTYFVVEVSRNIGDSEIEIQQTGYRALLNALQSADREQAAQANRIDLTNAVQRERYFSRLRRDILIAAGEEKSRTDEDRIISGREALTELSKQSKRVCYKGAALDGLDYEGPKLEEDELDYLYRLIRRSTSTAGGEIGRLVPYGQDGYCQTSEPSTGKSFLRDGPAGEITVPVVKSIFLIP